MAVPKLEKAEIKSTVEGPDVNDALDALDLEADDDKATSMLVAFCDLRTPDGILGLDHARLIVRFRLGTEGPGEVTVKIRPAEGDVAVWAASNDGEKDKLEEDWSATDRRLAFSRRREVPAALLTAAAHHIVPVVDVLSGGQRALIETVLGAPLPEGLRCFAPVLAIHWDLPVPDDDHRAEREAELWTVGETRFLEISERVKVGRAQAAQEDQHEFLAVRKVRTGTGQPKTGRVLRITSAVGVPPA